MNYFGTNLNSHGHFLWQLEGDHFNGGNLNFGDIPFNPEELVPTYTPEGKVEYFQFDDYSVCAIAGSCKDRRPGSKSVFWTKEKLGPSELKEMILSIPIAKRIIEQMPFGVQW